MTTILTIRESDWNKDGVIVKVSNVTLDDGREVPGYDLPPGLEEGKPLPGGWEVATAKSGKLYIKAPKPPKSGGGGFSAAYRNTQEGQRVEQDGMNRRTALMQAVATGRQDIFGLADQMYEWLNKDSAGKKAEGSSGRPVEKQAAVGAPDSLGEAVAPAAVCKHDMTSPLKPDGKALPDGFLRCLGCGVVKPEKGFL